jgi:hypothetical protein
MIFFWARGQKHLEEIIFFWAEGGQGMCTKTKLYSIPWDNLVVPTNFSPCCVGAAYQEL